MKGMLCLYPTGWLVFPLKKENFPLLQKWLSPFQSHQVQSLLYVVSFYKAQSCVIKNFKDATQKNRCVNAVWYPVLDPGMEKGH